MYIFKAEVLKDNIIDFKEIQQWKQLLEEYEKAMTLLNKETNEKDLNSLPDLVRLHEVIKPLINKQQKV